MKYTIEERFTDNLGFTFEKANGKKIEYELMLDALQSDYEAAKEAEGKGFTGPLSGAVIRDYEGLKSEIERLHEIAKGQHREEFKKNLKNKKGELVA